MDLEAKLWRAVSLHRELKDSIPHIARILADHAPVEVLLVRSLHLAQDPPFMATVALGSPGSEGRTMGLATRTSLDPVLLRRLNRWAKKEEFTRLADAPPGIGAGLVPPALPGTVLAAPLVKDGALAAVVLLVGPGTEDFDDARLATLQAILPPLRIAFENDQNVQELAHMRAALEADREALLTRLQRQDISEVVIGSSGGLQQVIERVEQVAPTHAPVLILGETGSGKEVIARAIHTRSGRARGPVVRVNCGAIPPELIDSELFGHERGAFTGAIATRKGWFERADGGTLFLDEIGELTPAAQVRLLRVLQDGTLQRVGGQQPLAVDVRIVAATNQRLEEMVTAGRFREDLWYRLSVFPIRLPALRERTQDIPALATHFAERAGKRLGGAALALSPQDFALLCAYSWPGNVRELGAVIERAAILGNGKRLDIPTALGGCHDGPDRRREASLPPSDLRGSPQATADPPFATLDEAMAHHIERALDLSKGCIEGPTGAAQLLGINPHTLRARMRKLGIRWDRFRIRRTPGPA